jgi:hypothetical protein
MQFDELHKPFHLTGYVALNFLSNLIGMFQVELRGVIDTHFRGSFSNLQVNLNLDFFY